MESREDRSVQEVNERGGASKCPMAVLGNASRVGDGSEGIKQ